MGLIIHYILLTLNQLKLINSLKYLCLWSKIDLLFDYYWNLIILTFILLLLIFKVLIFWNFFILIFNLRMLIIYLMNGLSILSILIRLLLPSFQWNLLSMSVLSLILISILIRMSIVSILLIIVEFIVVSIISSILLNRRFCWLSDFSFGFHFWRVLASQGRICSLLLLLVSLLVFLIFWSYLQHFFLILN